KLLRFEGLQGAGVAEQKKHFAETLYRISGKVEHKNTKNANWEELLILLAEYVKGKPCVVFFDEFPWMAAERNQLVSNLKYVWDNYFLIAGGVHLILGGSSTSLMFKKVIRSIFLINRVDSVIDLRPLTLGEVKNGFFANKDIQEALEYYLVMGGIPKYLEMYDLNGSVRQNLAQLCFKPDCFFFKELDQLFSYHFKDSAYYKSITKFLAGRRCASRNEIARNLGMKSGGTLSKMLENLQSIGVVEGYGSIHKPGSSKNRRFRLADPFLSFYYNFISHWSSRVETSGQAVGLYQALPDKLYDNYLDIAFKNFCHQHATIIAEKLKFGELDYEHGSWFKDDDIEAGAQVEMLFEREDNIIYYCDIKYRNRSYVNISDENERSVEILGEYYEKPIEKVLISAFPSNNLAVGKRGYSHVFTAESFG
ncbi:MAG: hypothetical protein OEM02_00695, partial [Desulfobulbaceae bacterium]|nr:hypothetical protein [Desulfobulbaceae bacterium]